MPTSTGLPATASGSAMGPPRQVGSGSRLIAAIDFGTTYTGLAWMQISSASTSAPTANDVHVLTNWPRKNTKKVPSVISYTPTTSGTKQWGHDIADGSDVLRWTKLELRPQSRAVELERLLDTARNMPFSTRLLRDGGDCVRSGTMHVPVHLGLAPVDIIADVLRNVARWWHDEMVKTMPRVWENVPVDLVVTHPGVWPYEARNQTVQAVGRAFSKSVFPMLRSISLCTEPEACALYTASAAIAMDRCRLYNGDCFIICDAGGGTVDFASYQLVSKRPFKIQQITAAASPECGASAFDRAFLAFLRRVIDITTDDSGSYGGGKGGHNIVERTERLLLDRVESIKHAFGRDGESIGVIELPGTCRVLDTEFARSRIPASAHSRSLQMTHDDLAEMFAPSVKTILEYLDRQAAQVRVRRGARDPTHIFMSGGFAESPHLLSQVKQWARAMNIEVERGDDCWGAVVRGAVLKGAGVGSTPPVPITFCPRSYGISVTPEYREYDGNFPPETQILWLAQKGDYIPDQGLIEANHDVYCRWRAGETGHGRQIRVEFVATAVDWPLPRSTLDLSDTDERIVMSAKHSEIPREAREKVPRSSQRFLGSHHSEAIVRVELRVGASGPRIALTFDGKELTKRVTSL